MSLNIKDQATHQLAQKLAEETGETMTAAVKVAIEERLARIRRRRNASAKAAELLAIGRRCASHLKNPAIDHGELLYDEKGLPK